MLVKGFEKEKLDVPKGILHQDLFRELCKNQKIDDKLVKTYLLNFDLAVELSEDKLFIHSVVSENKDHFGGHGFNNTISGKSSIERVTMKTILNINNNQQITQNIQNINNNQQIIQNIQNIRPGAKFEPEVRVNI